MQTRTVGAALGLAMAITMAACQKSPEEQAKANEAAMIEQAKTDAARDSEFVRDSVKLAATFTVDTVARPFTMNQKTTVEDDNGDTKDTTLVLHIIQGRRGMFCNDMDAKLWTRRAVGDTLTCQWSKRAEGVVEDGQ
jgi:hypothetical protein